MNPSQPSPAMKQAQNAVGAASADAAGQVAHTPTPFVTPGQWAQSEAARLFRGRKGHGGQVAITRRTMREGELAEFALRSYLAGRGEGRREARDAHARLLAERDALRGALEKLLSHQGKLTYHFPQGECLSFSIPTDHVKQAKSALQSLQP